MQSFFHALIMCCTYTHAHKMQKLQELKATIVVQ